MSTFRRQIHFGNNIWWACYWKENRINILIKKINIHYNDLTYYLKKGEPNSLINLNRPLVLLRKIKNDDIELEKPRKNQKEFKSGINEIVKVKEEYKSEEKKSTIKNVRIFYKARKIVINFFWWLF